MVDDETASDTSIPRDCCWLSIGPLKLRIQRFRHKPYDPYHHTLCWERSTLHLRFQQTLGASPTSIGNPRRRMCEFNAGQAATPFTHFSFPAFPTKLWRPPNYASPPAVLVSIPAPPIPDANLSLNEMLQIMDVARAIQEEQLTVEQQFQIEETRAKIRERLIASAKVAGDNVTNAEVDTAIQLYFDNLHLYRDPHWGFSRLCAQLYVWRVRVVTVLALSTAIAVGVWLAFFNAAMPWSQVSRATLAIRQAEQNARGVLEQLNVTAKDAAAHQAVDELTKEFHAVEASENIAAIQQSQQRMSELLATLDDSYTLQIVIGAGRDSAVTRQWNKGAPGALSYYVIVERRARDGRIVPQTVQDAETGVSKSVSQWGEQVPKEVYDRLKADKTADGVLNETRFGAKARGSLSESVLLPGTDGQPLSRGMRITQW